MNISIDQRELDRSIRQVSRELRRAVGGEMSDKMIQDILLDEAEKVKEVYRFFTPVGTTTKRISYSGRKTKKKLPPGNLRESITVFPGRDGPAVHVGPRVRGAKYGNKNADGFYGYWVDKGMGRRKDAAAMMDKTASRMRGTVVRSIISKISRKIDKANNRLNGGST